MASYYERAYHAMNLDTIRSMNNTSVYKVDNNKQLSPVKAMMI